ncbi:hypothetical protein TSUD_414730 [Trifolium subterraneum]|uniref:MI domain-containing protein n=1 Tax=Trifolium subterraneum TaxID=3900 RepID=A0A2Z6P5I6_TRISU|nr:hypothetical protein TSUD_414730 [Trifolium subterraneum]
MLCNIRTNNTNGIGYSSDKTLEEPSSSAIAGSFSLPNLYTTFVSDSTQMKQMKDKDLATNSPGPSSKWVPRDKIVYLIAGQTKTLDVPITWMHVNGKRAIVHRRHIFEESDGEEDEMEYISNMREYEEFEGLTWSKLLDPDKNGQWWLSGDLVPATDNIENIEVVANKIDKDVAETQRMLQLAAAQRMNTDSRRVIFCIIMSGEDYIDAFEKLLRLELPGKQDRDIMRVLVECCLQEKVFNKYYTVMASKLCEHDKNHKFTLQFCLWNHFEELESMVLLRSMHLAKFVAEIAASFTLSLTVLKTVDLSDITQLTQKGLCISAFCLRPFSIIPTPWYGKYSRV